MSGMAGDEAGQEKGASMDYTIDDKKTIWNRYFNFMRALKKLDKDIYKKVKGQGKRYLPSASIEDYGKISFGVGEKRFSNKHRIKTTLAKFLTKRIGLDIEPNRAGILGRDLAAILQSETLTNDVQVLDGEQIAETYYYFGRDDTPNKVGSCMSGSNCREYLRLYTKNPDDIKLLALNSPDEKARALLWISTFSKALQENVYFLDRIFSSVTCDENSTGAGALIAKARQIAKNAGVKLVIRKDYYRGHPSRGDTITRYDLRVCVDNVPSQYPYLDTFYSTDGEGSFADRPVFDLEALHTDGTLDGDHSYSCCNCSNRVNEDNGRSDDNGNVYCDDCYHEIYCYCEGCLEDHDRDNCTWISGTGYFCEACFGENYFYCEHCGDIHLSDDGISDPDGNCMYCHDCYCELYTGCEQCGYDTSRDDMEGDVCKWCHEDNEKEEPIVHHEGVSA